MNETIVIQDTRTIKELTKMTYSGYKKQDVLKELKKALEFKKVEESLYWCAELICSGQYLDIWNMIITFYATHIHIANPKMPIYIYIRYTDFKNIVKEKIYVENELHMRNNNNIRMLFHELILILIHSDRKHAILPIKVNKEDMNLTHMKHILVAPHTKFITCFKDNDPKEIFIPLNEFSYQLKEHCFHKASYWIEWLLCFEKICKHNKTNIQCAERYTDICKCNHDFIWLIWEIIFHYSSTTTEIQKRIIKALFDLFCIRYNSSQRKKRIQLLYCAMMILCEKINYTIPVHTHSITKMDTLINKIYKQIHK